ncbi:hypothetical protein A2U01_0037777, partial [Trifolium medium]|nr:hypothetical protein [Trifolium medium]MCI09572.1 hypothetical protein [Trifolium medium]MCI16633.1 hypothetical protein [Trifolium medium]
MQLLSKSYSQRQILFATPDSGAGAATHGGANF